MNENVYGVMEGRVELIEPIGDGIRVSIRLENGLILKLIPNSFQELHLYEDLFDKQEAFDITLTPTSGNSSI